jgi:hypothetical protein
VLHHWAWVPVEEVLDASTIKAFGAKPCSDIDALDIDALDIDALDIDANASALPELVGADKNEGQGASGVSGATVAGTEGAGLSDGYEADGYEADRSIVDMGKDQLVSRLSPVQIKNMQRNRKATLDISKAMMSRTVLGDIKATSAGVY